MHMHESVIRCLKSNFHAKVCYNTTRQNKFRIINLQSPVCCMNVGIEQKDIPECFGPDVPCEEHDDLLEVIINVCWLLLAQP